VPRVKSFIFIFWIVFGLIALMHGPLNLLGDFAEGFSCIAGVAVMDHSDKSTENEAPFGVLAYRRSHHMGNLPQVVHTQFGLPRAQNGPAIGKIKQKPLDSRLFFLLTNWQFWRRMSLDPRAP
jgi:hypothetical protein